MSKSENAKTANKAIAHINARTAIILQRPDIVIEGHRTVPLDVAVTTMLHKDLKALAEHHQLSSENEQKHKAEMTSIEEYHAHQLASADQHIARIESENERLKEKRLQKTSKVVGKQFHLDFYRNWHPAQRAQRERARARALAQIFTWGRPNPQPWVQSSEQH